MACIQSEIGPDNLFLPRSSIDVVRPLFKKLSSKRKNWELAGNSLTEKGWKRGVKDGGLIYEIYIQNQHGNLSHAFRKPRHTQQGVGFQLHGCGPLLDFFMTPPLLTPLI